MIETGSDDRMANMAAFTRQALGALEEALRAALIRARAGGDRGGAGGRGE
jgi:hypothetical protein